MSALLTLQQVSVHYQGRAALTDVSGELCRGALCAVVGANGAGKSTLLKAILGLIPLHSGQVQLQLARQGIGYLPQQSEIVRSFPMIVRDCALLGTWQRTGLFGAIPRAVQSRVDMALDMVGLAALAHTPISALSAGQFQRVLFARLIVQDAQLMLLDEPFNAIDAATTALLLSLIKEWHRMGRTVLAVLHDYAQVRDHFPQTLCLAQRVLAWGATDQVLCAVDATKATS